MDGVLAANFQRGRGAYCLHPKSSGLLLNGLYRRAMSVHFDRQRGEWKIDLFAGATALVGRLCWTIPMLGLMEQKYGSQTNDLAHLFGKRLAVASDGLRPLVPLT